LDLMKLWKGMWYTLYMADKAPVQDELSKRLAELMWCLAGTEEEDEFAGQVYQDMEESGMLVDDNDDGDGDDAGAGAGGGDGEEDDGPDVTMEEVTNTLDRDNGVNLDEEVDAALRAELDSDADSNSSSEVVDDSLLPHCRGAHLAALYVRTFLRTVRREWPRMDKYRVDKFYSALRYVVREVYGYMSSRHWNLGIVRLFNDTLYEEALNCRPNGLRYHLIDVTLDELARASRTAGRNGRPGRPLTEATFMDCLEPYFRLAQCADDSTVQKRVAENILDKFLERRSVVSDCYDSVAAEGEADDADEAEAEEDDDEVSLVLSQVHVGSVARFLFEVASDEDTTSPRYRRVLYGLHKKYLRRIKAKGRDVDLDEGAIVEDVVGEDGEDEREEEDGNGGEEEEGAIDDAMMNENAGDDKDKDAAGDDKEETTKKSSESKKRKKKKTKKEKRKRGEAPKEEDDGTAVSAEEEVAAMAPLSAESSDKNAAPEEEPASTSSKSKKKKKKKKKSKSQSKAEEADGDAKDAASQEPAGREEDPKESKNAAEEEDSKKEKEAAATTEDGESKKKKKKKRKKKKKSKAGSSEEKSVDDKEDDGGDSMGAETSRVETGSDLLNKKKDDEPEEEVIKISVKEQKRAAKRLAKKNSASTPKKKTSAAAADGGSSSPPRSLSPPSVNPRTMKSNDPDAVHSHSDDGEGEGEGDDLVDTDDLLDLCPDDDFSSEAVTKARQMERERKRVSFGQVNRSKSHKKSMRDLRRNDVPKTAAATPDRSILLKGRRSLFDEAEEEEEKGKGGGRKKKRKGGGGGTPRKKATDYF